MIWTGVTASAEESSTSADDTVAAINDVAGSVLDTAIDVSATDSTVSTGGGVNVDLSTDASDGILIDSPVAGDLEIGLPFADAADDAEVVDGVMVYDNNNGTTTTPLVHDDGSVQILTTIADANAPTAYEYQIGLAPGATLSAGADGGVAILDAKGEVTGYIEAPWAYDANGATVPTKYEVVGATLVQVVSHTGVDTAYPVVADPSISFGWKIYYNYSKSETSTYAKYTPYGTIASGICPFLLLGGPWSVAACVAALEVFAVSLDQTFNNAASDGNCVEITLPYYPSIVLFAAQMRWREVSC